MHPTKLQGIIPPMITPLKGDDELDREGAEQDAFARQFFGPDIK